MQDDNNTDRLYLRAGWVADDAHASWIPERVREDEISQMNKVGRQLESDRQAAIDEATSRHNPLIEKGLTLSQILAKAAAESRFSDIRESKSASRDDDAPAESLSWPMSPLEAENSPKNDAAREAVARKYEQKRLEAASRKVAEQNRLRLEAGTSFDPAYKDFE